MPILKLCAIYVFVYISFVASQEMTYQEKAYLLSETKCQTLINAYVAAPILLSAAHLVLLGKTVEILNPMQGRYSMRVIPQCIMKGDTNEKEIHIQNLGKTKCGSSNVEVGFNYLFFLRNTSDPKVFYALNSGAHVVTTTMLWIPVFAMFCGINRRVVCKTGECPGACNYKIPKVSSCISGDQTVYDTYKNEYPHGLPTTTTHKPSTARMVKTHAPMAVDKVTSTLKPTTQKVTEDSKSSTIKTTPMPKSVTEKTTMPKSSTTKTTTMPTGNTNNEAPKLKVPMDKMNTSANTSTSKVANTFDSSVNKTSTKASPSVKQTLATNRTTEVKMEKARSDNKTETKGDDSKRNKVAPYTPVINGTVAVQQSKSNPNGHGNNIHSNEHLVIATFLILHLLRS